MAETENCPEFDAAFAAWSTCNSPKREEMAFRDGWAAAVQLMPIAEIAFARMDLDRNRIVVRLVNDVELSFPCPDGVDLDANARYAGSAYLPVINGQKIRFPIDGRTVTVPEMLRQKRTKND